MPVGVSVNVAHDHNQGSFFYNNGIAQPPSVRGTLQAHSHNYSWGAPASLNLPTPAMIKAKRAQPHPASTPFSPKFNDVRNLDLSGARPSLPASKQARAEQMQARALAAQAAHQQRLAASLSLTDGLALRPAANSQPGVATASITTEKAPFGRDGRHHAVFTEDYHNPVSFPTLNDMDDVDIMDEIQVDLSLPVVDAHELSPVEAQMQYTSPSVEVDISMFMPRPGPPVLYANEATMFASAVPLGDWVTDLIWRFVSRPVRAHRAAAEGQWGADLFDVVQHGPNYASSPPAAFSSFVANVLSSTLPSPQCLFLGLYYLSKLPIGQANGVPRELDNPNTPPGVIALFASFNTPSWTYQERQFRDCLYNQACGEDEGDSLLTVAKLTLTVALMLGNKWLEDNTFTTHTWHDVTQIPQKHLRSVETAALSIFGFSLSIKTEGWLAWLNILRSYTCHVSGHRMASADSSEDIALRRIDDLLASAQATVTEQKIKGSPMLEDGDDLVLYPSVEERTQSPRRPRHGLGHSRTASLPAPTELDPWKHAALSAISAMGHAGMLQTAMSYGFQSPPHAMPQPMLLSSYHPDHAYWHNSTAHGRPDLANCFTATPWYRWDEVRAEIQAQERERDAHIRAWPRPSRLDWSGFGAKRLPTVIGV